MPVVKEEKLRDSRSRFLEGLEDALECESLDGLSALVPGKKILKHGVGSVCALAGMRKLIPERFQRYRHIFVRYFFQCVMGLRIGFLFITAYLCTKCAIAPGVSELPTCLSDELYDSESCLDRVRAMRVIDAIDG